MSQNAQNGSHSLKKWPQGGTRRVQVEYNITLGEVLYFVPQESPR